MTQDPLKTAIHNRMAELGLRPIDLARKLTPAEGNGVPTCYSQVRRFLGEPERLAVATCQEYLRPLGLKLVISFDP